MPLTIIKEKLFGRRNKNYIYRARLGSVEIAAGYTREQATTNAWANIEATMAVQMAAVRVAVAADGTVKVAREYQRGEVEVTAHRREDTATLYRSDGSSMGRLEIDGARVDLREYLTHEIERYNACTGTVEVS